MDSGQGSGSEAGSFPPPGAISERTLPDPRSTGRAGASARREHERRKRRREQRIDQDPIALRRWWRRTGMPPAHELSWKRGAEGEVLVAAELERRCSGDVLFLHDRRMPRSRANIDHIAIAPSGVWIIDSKRYSGRVRVERPWFGSANLTIGGRDRTNLIDGLERQREAVAKLAAAVDPEAAIRAALCFTPDADLPMIRSLKIRDLPLLYPRRLARQLSRSGPLDSDRRTVLRRYLATRLPAA